MTAVQLDAVQVDAVQLDAQTMCAEHFAPQAAQAEVAMQMRQAAQGSPQDNRQLERQQVCWGQLQRCILLFRVGPS